MENGCLFYDKYKVIKKLLSKENISHSIENANVGHLNSIYEVTLNLNAYLYQVKERNSQDELNSVIKPYEMLKQCMAKPFIQSNQ